MANFENIIQEINTNLPDNNTQSITAKKLRDTLIDTVYYTTEGYDISANNSGAKYADLTAALGDNGGNVPVDIRKEGMTIRFINYTTSKYEQYRYLISSITNNDFVNTENWQGVDAIPTAGSDNLVKSGGVYNTTPSIENTTVESDLDFSDEDGNVIMRLSDGHIKTKEFDSRNFNLSLGGKSFSIMGDSISTFQGMIPTGYTSQYPSGDVTTYDKTWWGKLIANDGMVLQINNSWAGSVISNTSTTGQICMSDNSRLDNLGTDPDFILFFGGTNDFGYTANAAQLGEFDFDKEQDNLDRTKFRQAVQYCIQQIQKLYPKSQLMMMLPLQRGRYNEYGTLIQDYPAKNSLGLYEFEYNFSLKEAADIFGVPVIDTNKCGITFYNGTNNPSSSGGQALYTIDGVHPNAAGMNLIYKSVKNKLLEYI